MVRSEQVLHVARLAKLRLTAEEERRLGPQLDRILEFVEQLRELDGEVGGEAGAEAVPPGPAGPAGPPGDGPRLCLRSDEPRPSLPRDEILRGAPSTDGETFRVPPPLDAGGGP